MTFPVQDIRESVIREMTRLCGENCINLSQGYPELDPPPELLEEAVKAIRNGENQYSITWGLKLLRERAGEYTLRFYGLHYDPEKEITITCGGAEGVFSSILALCGPGDRVIFFEPYYENYLPAIKIAKAEPLAFSLEEDFSIDFAKLKKLFSKRVKALILNTPNNPTGKVFSEEEIKSLVELCEQFDCYIISDEIYHQMTYEGRRHVSPALFSWERTVIVHSISKTYCLTGWRVGWVLAPEKLSAQIRKVHDYATVAAPTPFQIAAARALTLPEEYYSKLRADLERKRNFMLETLTEAGFRPVKPYGAYYIMAFFENNENDWQLARRLIEEAGVAAVPGSSFYVEKGKGEKMLRFAYAKKWQTLHEVRKRLLEFKL